MKRIVFLLAFTLISTAGFANCNNAYASAGYGLSHAKKSMEANNFEHQQYYAERALQAFEKTRDQNESCGCPGANDPILDGIENLKTALEQDKWDNGRFYTKKALENAEQVLSSLDMCTLGTDTAAQADTDESEVVAEGPDLTETEEAEAEKMWEVKVNLRQNAEAELAALEKSIRDLAMLLECERAMQVVRERKIKSDQDLRAESLSAIRSYYMSQVVSLHNKALFAMLECSKK